MKSSGVQLSIGDLLYAIKKRIKLIILLTFVGLIIGGILSAMTYLQGTMSRNYSINASVVVTAQSASGRFRGDVIPDRNDFLMSKEMTDTVRYIMKSDKIMQNVIDQLGLVGVSPRAISGNLTLNQWNETPVIELSLTWRSSEEGIAIMKKLLELSSKMLQDSLKTGTVTVLSDPSARYIVGGSVGASTWGFIAILGMFAGIGIAVLDILVRPTLINISDVQKEFNLETIGVIPEDVTYFKDNERSLIEKLNDSKPINQDYSAAAYVIRNRLGKTTDHHRLYVTSAGRQEGKTTIAANIAIQLAEMEQKVLLVDFNTRNPELGSLFLKRVDFDHSLNALYRGEINESEAITSITGYLDILPVVLEHTPIPLDGMILELIDNLSQNYNYVIMDTPPVGLVSGTLSINQIADAALFVIGYDMTQKGEILEAINLLDKSGVKILGCIVNREKSIENNMFQKEQPEKKKKKRERSRKTNDIVAEMMKASKSEPEETEIAPIEEEQVTPSLDVEGMMKDLMPKQAESELDDEDAINELLKIGSEE